MWHYLNQKISAVLAVSIILLFSFVCFAAVRIYAKTIIKEIERSRQAIEEMGPEIE